MSQTKRTTSRGNLIPQLVLGKVGSSYNSNRSATPKELEQFVKDFKVGPTLVSVPVKPQRHAFFIDIQKEKIMVSDWGGKDNETNDEEEPEWFEYCELLRRLSAKYRLPIEFYEVDEELYCEANKHNEVCGGGGCSYYIYKWVKKNYTGYKI
jgi:hypothetical protein